MELSEARKRLDRIDSGMLELFEHRMEVIARIADYKESNSLPVRDEAREKEIIASFAERSSEENAPYAARFIEAVIALSCDYQTDRRKNMDKNSRKTGL